MTKKNPTYPNPTIREAVCEIHFRLSPGEEWQASIPGELFKHIQEEFPVFEPVSQMGIQLEMGPGDFGQRVIPGRHRIRYKHHTRNLLIQLAENIITVNELPEYPGWKQMRNDVLDTWEKLTKIVKAVSIERIGLRYINHIPRVSGEEKAGDWLSENDHIAKSVLDSLPGFFSRIEIRKNEHHRRIVTVGELKESKDAENGVIILDIDCIVEKEIMVTNESIFEEVDMLHDDAWEIFSSMLKSKLEKRLKEVD
jgi:uncharacterized protein (TIGR04255 family)